MKRNNYLDTIRGITIVSMILYHGLYDIAYIFNRDIFFTTENTFIWQQSICISFILISGISSYLASNRRLLKRGILVFSIGLIIKIITNLISEDVAINFGILSLIGTSMILTYYIRAFLNKNYYIFIFIILFIIFYKVDLGYINLFFNKIDLPKEVYNLNLYFLGFPSDSFRSADYFPIIPWIFLYLSGFVLGKILVEEQILYKYKGEKNFLSFMGRHSLEIYISHQIILLAILYFIFNFIL